MSIPPVAIALGVVLVVGIIVLLIVKGIQTSPVYRSVSQHTETMDQAEGGWKELRERRNARASRYGWMIFGLVVILACGMFALAKPAQKVQAALWPTDTPTASITPSATVTRTLKPTLAVTTTPAESHTPTATQTSLVTPTARIVYQNSTQIVRVERTVIVKQTVMVTIPVTVIVYQTVLVLPIDTPTEESTPTVEATTETATTGP
jgi:hypothetical protein